MFFFLLGLDEDGFLTAVKHNELLTEGDVGVSLHEHLEEVELAHVAHGADLDDMLDNVNSLVDTSEKSVQDTVKKIDDIDLDSLNKAINDLSTIIAPLAKLFRK